MLSPLTINEHRDNLYCKACYHMVFMQKVLQIYLSFCILHVQDYLEYTSLEYGGIVMKEDMELKEEEERKTLEKAEQEKNDRKCPICEKKV